MEQLVNAESHRLCMGSAHLAARVSRNRRRNVRSKVVGAVLMTLVSSQILAQVSAPEQATAPDCKCRSPDGQMQSLGTVQCVDIVGRKNLMRCEMSTNTPYWKKLEGVSGCPDA